MAHKVLKSCRSEMSKISNEIMETMRPPDYQHNGFVATHVLRHMMYVKKFYIMCLILRITTKPLC